GDDCCDVRRDGGHRRDGQCLLLSRLRLRARPRLRAGRPVVPASEGVLRALVVRADVLDLPGALRGNPRLARFGLTTVSFLEAEAEELPFSDASFDVVISNGVIDLIPDKDAAFSELHRVLRPGARLQIADVTIQQPVPDEGRRNIDLWTG